MAHVRVHAQFVDPTTGDTRILPTLIQIGCQPDIPTRTETLTRSSELRPCLSKPTRGTRRSAFGLVTKLFTGWRRELTKCCSTSRRRRHRARRLVWTGEARIFHFPTIGPRVEDTRSFAGAYVLAWDPELAAQNPPDNVWRTMTHHEISVGTMHASGHYVTCRIDFRLKPDNSLNFASEFCWFEDDEKQDDQTYTASGNIFADNSHSFSYVVTHNEFLDSLDYGRVSMTIRNEWSKY